MTSHAQFLADFRSQITRLLQERDKEWEASRRLLDGARLSTTVKRLVECARETDVPQAVREALLTALNQGEVERIQDLPGSRLKELTGLPPSKALRALCVWFDLAELPASRWPVPSLDSETVATFVQDHVNPFDLLVTTNVASLLELGAGDLSLASEVADLYAARIREQNRTLMLHCLDRLHPQSKLGGPLHPQEDRLQALRSRSDLSFQFLAGQDLYEYDRLVRAGRLASRYAVAACWAPATPTFAYEPTRVSPEVIQKELERTKGAFRQTRYVGEPALEVQHGDRMLLFPPWKFEIRGPLVLLEVLARGAHLGLLGAVDNQVFWEIMAQLLEEERYRPADELFTAETLPAIFGHVYEQLSALPIGERLDLRSCGPLRTNIPRVLPAKGQPDAYRFRSVMIRRGALFPDMPASSTARRFPDMAEEPLPWMLTLVPDC
jgi:hypothetical protein